MNLVQRWIIRLKSDRCECVFLCCCYGHWLLFIFFFCLTLFFEVSLGKFEALCFCAGQRPPPYAVSAPTLAHLAPVFHPLCLFPWDPALESETTSSIRKLSQGHPDPQFLPPSDNKLMSWHTCEVGQTFKDQSGDFLDTSCVTCSDVVVVFLRHSRYLRLRSQNSGNQSQKLSNQIMLKWSIVQMGAHQLITFHFVSL